MQQHDCGPFAALDIMQPHAIELQKLARRRVLALGTPCLKRYPGRSGDGSQ